MVSKRQRNSEIAAEETAGEVKPRTFTLDQVAGMFRVTEKAVRDWIGAGMPVEILGTQGRGKKTAIDLEAAVRWYFEANFERLQLDRERAMLAAEQRETAALRNAQARGDLASIGELAKQFSDAVAVVHSVLLSIPAKEAPEIAPLNDANAIESRLRKAIYEALQQLADYRSAGAIESRQRRRARHAEIRATTD